ncbi:MAG: hypothetical protein ABW140_15390, partial [Candidatus Sedimenticola sp. 6PFRAG1]
IANPPYIQVIPMHYGIAVGAQSPGRSDQPTGNRRQETAPTKPGVGCNSAAYRTNRVSNGGLRYR